MLQFTCIRSTRNERSKLKTRIMTLKGISHIAQQLLLIGNAPQSSHHMSNVKSV